MDCTTVCKLFLPLGEIMKFRVTFKTPDALDEAVGEIDQKHADKAYDLAQEFVEFGEYITVEFDTTAKTCVVLKCSY